MMIDAAPIYAYPSSTVIPASMTDYVGISGPDLFSTTGVFGFRYDGRPLRLVNITDGTSNTVMIGEKPYIPPPAQGTINNSTFVNWVEADTLSYAMGIYYINPVTNESDTTSGVQNSATEVFKNLQGTACASGPYYFGQGPNTPSNFCSYNYLYSGHNGGANFCLADGSVRFVNYSISASTLAAASTYAGNDMLGSDW
jgi:prepilin-type processing-associated H-X9-DG protein